MDVVGIVSNHPQAALYLSVIDGSPYHHRPVTKGTKPWQEAAIKVIVEEKSRSALSHSIREGLLKPVRDGVSGKCTMLVSSATIVCEANELAKGRAATGSSGRTLKHREAK